MMTEQGKADRVHGALEYGCSGCTGAIMQRAKRSLAISEGLPQRQTLGIEAGGMDLQLEQEGRWREV